MSDARYTSPDLDVEDYSFGFATDPDGASQAAPEQMDRYCWLSGRVLECYVATHVLRTADRALSVAAIHVSHFQRPRRPQPWRH